MEDEIPRIAILERIDHNSIPDAIQIIIDEIKNSPYIYGLEGIEEHIQVLEEIQESEDPDDFIDALHNLMDWCQSRDIVMV